jgi:hypothetical protein
MNAKPFTRHSRLGSLPLLLMLGLTLMAPRADAALRAWLDRDQIYTGDSVTLTIQADGANQPGQPDLGVLAADFDVLGSSRGSEIRIINGQHSANTSWRINLSPKRGGTLRIPPIPVGGETTDALTLQVDELPEEAQGGPGDDVFVELELGVPADEVVVQQQVPISVRLFSARNLLNGGLSEPRANDAVLERLGEDRRYRTSRNGREYQVIERRYSLSPEHSGKLRIPPVVFEGEIEAKANAGAPVRGGLFDDSIFDRMFDDSLLRRGFSMLERGEPVRAQSEALTLDVAASPNDFAGEHWLPAEALTVSDDWADNPPELRVGEPATRTLTLTAKGLSGSQIPAIEMPAPDGVRHYAEPPESESRTDGATLYGVSRQTFTVIPTKGGTLTLPAIEVRWWDTKAQRERIARVPAQTLPVAGGTVAAGVGPGASAAASQQPRLSAEQPAAPDGVHSAPADTTSAGLSSIITGGAWTLIGAIIVAVLLAAGSTAWWWIQRYNRQTRDSIPSKPRQPSARNLREPLRQACLADNPQAAAKALIAWAQARWPERPPANLAEIARRLPTAGDPIRSLEQTLYAPEGGGWQGNALWQAIAGTSAPAEHTGDSSNDGLMPLYPHRLS